MAKPQNNSATTQGNPKVMNRRTTPKTEVFSEKFRLEPSIGKKYIGWMFEDDPRQWEDMNHPHWFTTVDRKGNFNKYSTPQSTHFHECELVVDEEQKPVLDKDGYPTLEVGPALQYVTFYENGMKKTKIAPVFMFNRDGVAVNDEHTHKAYYYESFKTNISKVSPENAARAAQIMTDLAAKAPKPPEGLSV
jgi:hypothetical protein